MADQSCPFEVTAFIPTSTSGCCKSILHQRDLEYLNTWTGYLINARDYERSRATGLFGISFRSLRYKLKAPNIDKA
jgi:hypothetical protein